MIEFQHKLPTRYAEGRNCGTYNNRELGFSSILTTHDPDIGLFIQRLRTNIFADRSLVFIDGKILVTDKNWIRDHVHIMKAMRHWEYERLSLSNTYDINRGLTSFSEARSIIEEYQKRRETRALLPKKKLPIPITSISP